MKVCASLYLYGPNLQPDEITTALGFIPTTIHSSGDRPRPGARPYPQGMWAIEFDEDHSDASVALESLFSQIPNANYAGLPGVTQAHIDLMLTVEGEEDTKFLLSNELVSQLTTLGLGLQVTAYRLP